MGHGLAQGLDTRQWPRRQISGLRQIFDWFVDVFFVLLGDFLQGQFRLRRRRVLFAVAINEPAGQPAEQIIGNRLRNGDVWILCKAAGLKTLVRKFGNECIERYAVLERKADQCADRIH